MLRREAVGRWAEWKDAGVLASDTRALRLGVARAAQRDRPTPEMETVNILSV